MNADRTIWAVLQTIVFVFAAMMAFKPNWFIYIFSYGGRLKYDPPKVLVIFTRLIAAAVFFGLLFLWLTEGWPAE